MNTWVHNTVQFFKDAYAELLKVTWLTRKEVIGSTVIVIILVIIIAIFVGAIDFVLARFLGFIL